MNFPLNFIKFKSLHTKMDYSKFFTKRSNDRKPSAIRELQQIQAKTPGIVICFILDKFR